MAETAPDNLASLRGFFSRVPLHVTAHLLMAIAADGPGVSEKDVAAIAVPTLIIGHKRDDIHPLAHAQRLASLIAQAKFVEVMPKATDPARYAEDFRCAVAQFLKSL
jgi:pimeloyl-ACP methyl ester carboxylesterase